MSAAAEELYERFGLGLNFDSFESGLDTRDLKRAVQLGSVRTLVYLSDKQGEWTEYEHEFRDRPALYELGCTEGETIEAFQGLDEREVNDLALLGGLVELTYEDADGDLMTIDDPAYVYGEPTTEAVFIETLDGQKFVFVHYQLDDWLYE
jgi:hypothetical protein